ncbi:MAG: ISAs1 family transposase [Bifidobacteriaceae bacterium]|nr:ISAs1 family transposase [Bifidobacteriaceae bacterium]
MRGAKNGAAGAPHLVAALTHGSGLVVRQVRVDAKTDEIPAARDLLGLFDLGGMVVTLDAMHTQTKTAEFITDRGADYVFMAKDNQPTLKAQLAALAWRDVPGRSHTDRGHGRTVTRTVKALAAPAWIEFPGRCQVLQIRRTRTVKGKRGVEAVCPIRSAPMERSDLMTVAEWIQGHWGIETRLHHVRCGTSPTTRTAPRSEPGTRRP